MQLQENYYKLTKNSKQYMKQLSLAITALQLIFLFTVIKRNQQWLITLI